jgi:hypothetical protein
MNKLYHIYVKNECVYQSLPKEDFDILWDFVQKLTWLTVIDENDIQYEEITLNKELVLNSSH